MADSRIAGGPAVEKRAQQWGVAITVASATTIALLTLLPAPESPPTPTSGGLEVTDIVLNIILFFPLGTGLALLGCRRLSATAIGALASAGIEFCQIFLVAGRNASVLDVATNTGGTALGALLVSTWATRSFWWGRIGPMVSAAGITAWIAGGVLIRPNVPATGLWYSSWAHDFGGTVLYPGRILSFTLNGVGVPDGPIEHPQEIRAVMIREGTTRVEAQIVTGGKFDGLAQLVGIVTKAGEELVSAWQEGSFLKARHRTNSTRIGLRTVWFSMPARLLETAGDTVTIRLEMSRTALSLEAVRGTVSAKALVPLAPELFWTGFIPFDYEVGVGVAWLPLLAAGLVFLAIGLGAVRHPSLGAVATLAGLFGAPFLAGTAYPGIPTSALALLALIAGLGFGRRLGLGAPPG